MINEGKIGVQESISLIVMAICSKIFFTSPGFLTTLVGTAGWLTTLISCTTSIVLFTFTYLLLKRFPGKNIVEVFNITLGSILGFLFSSIYAIAFLFEGSVVAREFADFMKIFTFPETPISFIIGAFIFVIAAAVYLGLESIARVAKLVGYSALGGYILVIMLSATEYRLANLFPVFGYGLDRIFLNGVVRSSAYSEVIILSVIAGSLQGSQHIKKIGYTSLVLSGVLLSMGLICMNLVFPYYITQEIVAPLYIMARSVEYGAFIQRLEPVALFLWIITTIITVSILLYCTVSVYCKMFRLQDMRPVIIPLSVIMFTAAMFPKDFSIIVGEYVQGTRTYGAAVFYLLPLITLLVSLVRGKRTDNKRNHNTGEGSKE